MARPRSCFAQAWSGRWSLWLPWKTVFCRTAERSRATPVTSTKNGTQRGGVIAGGMPESAHRMPEMSRWSSGCFSRLLYVGMTRAQVALYLIFCESRWAMGTAAAARALACLRVGLTRRYSGPGATAATVQAAAIMAISRASWRPSRRRRMVPTPRSAPRSPARWRRPRGPPLPASALPRAR